MSWCSDIKADSGLCFADFSFECPKTGFGQTAGVLGGARGGIPYEAQVLGETSAGRSDTPTQQAQPKVEAQ